MRKKITLPGAVAAAIVIILLVPVFQSCCKRGVNEDDSDRNVLLLYAAGFNSLSSYIAGNIKDISEGTFLPGKGKRENVLLVYVRQSRGNTYDEPKPSYLIRMYRSKGETVLDTLVTYNQELPACTKESVSNVLNYVHESFPAKNYGLIFSSHGTGWVPKGYYNNTSNYENSLSTFSNAPRKRQDGAVPWIEVPRRPGEPEVRSIGQDQVGNSSTGYVSYELDIPDFAAAIPFRLDYIIFDACLMGGVEVAYQLKDVAGQIAFSPTEVLASGFDYGSMIERLLKPSTPDLNGVCEDFFNFYDQQTGEYRSATITLLDTGGLDKVASVCNRLIAGNREALDALNPSQTPVQPYFRYDKHWYYDLVDIFRQAGASEAELAELTSAIDACTPYKNATEKFIGIRIDTYSGLSMYLPSKGSPYLDAFYKDLDWNKACGLVK